MKKQVDDAKLFGVQNFCKDLLEVADILSKATESVASSQKSDLAFEQMQEGLRLTELQLLKVFEKHGLVKISPAEGDKFDPNFHEALFQQPASENKVPGTVAVVSKIGYKLHSRTLRPALVGVFG
jgi:molecular chaperone GrpE